MKYENIFDKEELPDLTGYLKDDFGYVKPKEAIGKYVRAEKDWDKKEKKIRELYLTIGFEYVETNGALYDLYVNNKFPEIIITYMGLDKCLSIYHNRKYVEHFVHYLEHTLEKKFEEMKKYLIEELKLEL